MELLKKISVENGKVKGASSELNRQKFRIKATDNLPNDVYITKIGNTKKFSKGNISAWTGAAKSKKTFAMTMLVASMCGGTDLYGKFSSYKKNKVIWFDTEQSPNDVQKVVKRIKRMINSEEMLEMYALRPLTPAERVKIIEETLQEVKCDVVVIDGARDLLMNINDAEESTRIVTKMMKWSYEYDIHISTVVHTSNQGLKVRGHIGTEIENKSETVIKVERDNYDVNISEIKEMYGRGKGFEAFTFFIDKDGLPVVSEVVVKEVNKDDVPF